MYVWCTQNRHALFPAVFIYTIKYLISRSVTFFLKAPTFPTTLPWTRMHKQWSQTCHCAPLHHAGCGLRIVRSVCTYHTPRFYCPWSQSFINWARSGLRASWGLGSLALSSRSCCLNSSSSSESQSGNWYTLIPKFSISSLTLRERERGKSEEKKTVG